MSNTFQICFCRHGVDDHRAGVFSSVGECDRCECEGYDPHAPIESDREVGSGELMEVYDDFRNTSREALP